MNKKLTAKIQKLIPTLSEAEVAVSSCIAIEPPEKDVILKKGFVYSVFDIKNQLVLDVSLVGKIINDVLYESYYNSESISPIQSLEKSIMSVSEKLTNLYKTEGKTEEKIEINIISAVLWGNVLYLVQYGKGGGFLVRDGNITPIKYTSENNFSVSSGMVKPDDVLILNTEHFGKKFSPQKLLDTAISPTDMAPDQSCLIIKFIVGTEFTQDEIVDFNLPKEKRVSKFAGIVDNIKNKLPKKAPKENPIESLVDVGQPVAPPRNYMDNTKIKIKSTNNPRIKINLNLILIFTALILIGSVASTIILRAKSADTKPVKTEKPNQLTQPTEQDKNQNQEPETITADLEVQKAEDEKNMVERIKPNIFYDLKLADQNSQPTGIALLKNNIVVIDTGMGKIFTSTYDTPQFTAVDGTFPGIKSVSDFENDLIFADNQGYKRYNLTDNTTKESFAGSFNLFDTYIGNIYSVEEGKIVKYVKSENTLTSSTWAENESFNNIKSIVVAYNIYLLMGNGNLDVYTQGVKSTFALTGLDKPLQNPVKIETDINFDNIYIADSGNSRIVVVTTAGKFVKQYKTENESDWSDIKSIAVTDDENKMYVLNSTRIFEVNLGNE